MRTPLLWGLGVRARFLHDARASTLEEAIQAHGLGQSQGSTAAAAFGQLSKEDAKDLMKFLRSL